MRRAANFKTASVLATTLFLAGTSLFQVGCTEQVLGNDNTSAESSPELRGPVKGADEDTHAVSSDMLSASGKEAPSVNAINCNANPVVPFPAFNGQAGEAICQYGVTELGPYANQAHEFVIGVNHRVYHTWGSSNGLAGWEDQGGYLTSGVIAGTVDGGALRICAIGSDNVTVYMKEYLPSRGWGVWVNVGPAWAHCPLQRFPRSF